jgi:hypothetical protein
LTAAAWEGKLDVEVEYKRLLLLGLTDQLTDRRSGTTEWWSCGALQRLPIRALAEQFPYQVWP